MKIGSPINIEAYVPLPTEVLQHIISFLQNREDSQRDLWACCLVSRQWYSASLSTLYERPRLRSRNFERFLSAIHLPANLRKHHAEVTRYIKHLDLSAVAYESSNSKTARLLHRVRERLETFVAPARSLS